MCFMRGTMSGQTEAIPPLTAEAPFQEEDLPATAFQRIHPLSPEKPPNLLGRTLTILPDKTDAPPEWFSKAMQEMTKNMATLSLSVETIGKRMDRLESEIAVLALQIGTDPSSAFDKFQKNLILAASRGDLAVVEQIVKIPKINLEQADSKKWSALGEQQKVVMKK